jgi:hypothetical protein
MSGDDLKIDQFTDLIGGKLSDLAREIVYFPRYLYESTFYADHKHDL